MRRGGQRSQFAQGFFKAGLISKGRLAACDTPENLERLFAGAASVELEAECTREEAAGILSSVPGAVINSISEADGGV